MKAKIINDVLRVPHIINFDGEKIDLQFTPWVMAKIEEEFSGGMDEVYNNIGKINVIIKLVTIMMNNGVIVNNFKNDTEDKLYTFEYVSAVINPKELAEIILTVGEALGLNVRGEDSEVDEANAELDAAIADEFEEEETEKN